MSFLSALRNAKNKVLQAVAPSKPGQAVNKADIARQFFKPSTIAATAYQDVAPKIGQFAVDTARGVTRGVAGVGMTVAHPTKAYEETPTSKLDKFLLGTAPVKNIPGRYQGNVSGLQDISKGKVNGGLAKTLAVPLTFAGLTADISNPLEGLGKHGAEKAAVKLGENELPSLLKKIHVDDLRNMSDFVDYAKGGFKKATKSFEPTHFEANIRDMAAHYGFNPNQTNKALAKDFNKVLNQSNEGIKALDQPLKATIPQSKSSPITIKDIQGKFAGSKPGMATAEQPLIQEAKKYKTADEFVKAQTNAYHGTDAQFTKFDPKKAGAKGTLYGKGTYLSDSKDVSSKFGKNLMDVSVDRGSFLIPDKKLPENQIASLKKVLGEDYANWDKIPNGDWLWHRLELTHKNPEKILQKAGIHGVEYTPIVKGGANYKNSVVFNADTIRTKQQLTDIYNQAHGKGLNPLVLPKDTKGQAGFFDPAAFIPKKLRDKLGLSQPELQQVARQGEPSTGTLESLAKDSLPQEARAAEQAVPTAGGGLLDRIQQAAGKSTLGKSSLTDIALNTNKFNVSPEAKATIKANIEQIRPELESIVGRKLSNEETKNAAVGAEMLSKTVSRDSTKEFAARLTKLRQTIAAGSEGKGVSADFIENLKTLKSIAADQGRKLQAFAIGADPEFKSVKEDIVKKILGVSDKTDEIIKAAEGVDFSNPKQVTELYRKFIKPGIGEVIDEYRYINLLSSPKTHLTNIFSNMLQVGLNPVTKLASGTLDSVASMLTGKARQHYVSEVPQYVRGLMSSIPTATADAFDVLTGKKFGGRPDLNMLGTNVPILRSGQIIPRALEASDIFFQSMIKDGEKAAISHRYKVLGKSLTPEMLDKQATEKAKYWVFHGAVDSANATGQGHLLSSIDKMTDAVYTLRKVPGVKWFIPFVQTPMNILKQMVEFSPAGLATLPGAKDKTEQLAKTLVGSMVFAGAGSIVMNNDVTWDVPTDKTGKEDFFAAGRKPYSIKINGNWVDYTKLGPLSFPIAMAAAIKNESVKPENQSKDTQEKIMLVTKDLAKFFTDQSYLTGMSDLIRTLQGDDQSLKRTITNMPRQLVPLSSLQGWVARIIDPVYRKSGSTLDSIKATIPFLSKTVQAYTDSAGQESKRPLPVFNSLSPVQVAPSDQKAEGQYKEIQQLRQATSEQKQATSLNQSKATAIIHELKDLQPEQRKAALAELVQSGHLTPEVLSEVKSQITKSAKPQPTSNLDKRLASAPIAARAQIVISEIKGLSPEDRKARLAELVSEGIVTKETLQQMAQQARK